VAAAGALKEALEASPARLNFCESGRKGTGICRSFGGNLWREKYAGAHGIVDECDRWDLLKISDLFPATNLAILFY